MAADSLIADIQLTSVSRADLERRFAVLLDTNRHALARLAASYTRTASDRDDLLQDIALALWQALPRFRGECSERTFLFRIAHNRCVSRLSRKSTFVALDEEQVDIEDPAPTAERQMSQDQKEQRLLDAVRQLPLIYRQVVTLTLEGLSYREVGDVLGIGESNVGVRLTRGRQLLKALLEEVR